MSKDSPFERFVKRLKLEALSLALLMVALTYISDAPIWILAVTFPLFDIGMLGYLKNTTFGALTYNFFHDLTVPTLLIVIGLLFNTEPIAIAGFCWTFHVAVDRSLGFGLKHPESFHLTHLGSLKKK